MSRTTPVRWWRDDADRYVTRGPQIVPAAKVDTEWAFDLVASPLSSIWAELDEWRMRIATALAFSIRAYFASK